MINNGLILLVEDNPDDYEATVRSLKKNHLTNPIKWCKSGKDAYDYLHRINAYSDDSDVHTPIMILLDLNMPGMDGRELLREMKKDDSLRRIPTIVLTTSNDPMDVDQCYLIGASTYIQKPVGFKGLTESLKTMKDYWFGIAILPVQEDENG